METIVPITGEWYFCTDDEWSTGIFHRVGIIAWAVSLNGIPVPITPFGRADVSGEYLVQSPSGDFVILPNGLTLRSWNDAKGWLTQQRRSAAA